MASAFKLLHFHIGSQVPDILTIKRAVRDARCTPPPPVHPALLKGYIRA